jgi:hypothetical protein
MGPSLFNRQHISTKSDVGRIDFWRCDDRKRIGMYGKQLSIVGVMVGGA